MSERIEILEYTMQSGGGLVVDPEAATIDNVRILGLASANGRDYLPEAVKAAIGLYEGKATNINHPARPGEPTTIERRNGWLSAVRQESDGGLRGKWSLLKSDPQTAKILEVAQRNPSLLGLSHNVSGKVRREGGREIVESIDCVHSVDVVADPATVQGLHEQRQGSAVKSTVKKLIESLKTTRPAYARSLREMAEAGVMSPDTPMDAPPDAPAGEADSEEAILNAAGIVLKDTSLSVAERLSKIRKLLRLTGAAGGNGDTADTGEGAEGDMGAAEESKKLKLENAGLRLLLEAGLKPTKVLSRALAGCTSEAEMKELIEEVRTSPGAAQRPRSAAPPAPSGQQQDGSKRVQEQRGGNSVATVPEDAKARARWLQTPG